jgi:hypothetical protein
VRCEPVHPRTKVAGGDRSCLGHRCGESIAHGIACYKQDASSPAAARALSILSGTGVEALDNTSAALGLKSEPQPDCLLRILSEYGGRTDADRRFVRGVPELLVEVAHSSRYNDLGPKFDDYERVGVQEYVVHAFDPTEVLWFVLRNGHFIELTPDPDGIYRSEVFPGLWLDPQALIKGDTRRLRAVLDLGFATPEHAEFVARLAHARRAE